MELSVSNGFVELNESVLSEINAGGVWGVISGAAQVVAGAAAIVGGAAAMAIPEPAITKYAGGAAIVGGVFAVGAGVTTIVSNLK